MLDTEKDGSLFSGDTKKDGSLFLGHVKVPLPRLSSGFQGLSGYLRDRAAVH